jgi:hypothetical protein
LAGLAADLWRQVAKRDTSMGWLSRLIGQSDPKRAEHAGETFLPREWSEHFAGVTAAKRRAFATDLCRRVIASAGLRGVAVEQAMAALDHDQVPGDLLLSIQSLVQRLEGEYDSLMGGDESRLSCSDPEIDAAFRKYVAASALRCALEGDLSGAAYEAWFVLDDLAEIRRLAGMAQVTIELRRMRYPDGQL